MLRVAAILEPAATSKINHVSRSQPVCTAIQIALVQLLSEWGIVPHSVIGHSSGSYILCVKPRVKRLIKT